MAKSDLTQPLVSVIIPSYNSGPYIAETLNSVFAQTYKNLEIIVVDDASPDNTAEVLANITTDRNFSVIHKEQNSGAAASRNTGYRASKGSLIKFLDADDTISADMIAEQVALAENDDNIISAKWGRFVNNDIATFKLSPEECWQTLPSADWVCSSWNKAKSMTNPGIFLIPRKIIRVAGLWDENLSLLDDTEYFARTILAAEKIIFSTNSILYYRSGIKNSLSRVRTHDGFWSAYTAIEKATTALLNKRHDDIAKLACANFWQYFIYDIYPLYPDLIQKAEAQLKYLPKPSLLLPSGGYTKLLLNVFGWKTIQSFKHKFSK